MNHCHSWILQKIPIEITSNIFEIVVSDSIDVCDKTQARQHVVLPPPLRLIRVCQTWKQIAESISRIWRYLSVDLELVDDISGLEFIRKWITRTRTLPLNVYFYITPMIYNEPQEHLFSIVDVLTTSSAQWQNVSLRLPYATLSHLCQTAGRVPLLDILKIESIFPDLFDDGDVPSFPFCGHDKPSPKSLFVAGIHSQVLNLEWISITTLTAQHVTTHQCILLRFEKSLRVCKFKDIRIDSEDNLADFDFHNPPLVTHHNLEQMSFSSDCPDLLYCLILPNVKCFTYENEQGIDDWDAIRRFFTRTRMPLENLEILNIVLDYEQLFPLFRNIPTVQHLRLSSDVIHYREEVTPTPLLKYLGQTSTINTERNGNILLPNLTSLTLEMANVNFVWEPVPLIFGNIVNTINNSRLYCRPLSSFKVVDPRDPTKMTITEMCDRLIDENILEQLLDIQRAGANIVYESKDGQDLFIDSILVAKM